MIEVSEFISRIGPCVEFIAPNNDKGKQDLKSSKDGKSGTILGSIGKGITSLFGGKNSDTDAKPSAGEAMSVDADHDSHVASLIDMGMVLDKIGDIIRI